MPEYPFAPPPPPDSNDRMIRKRLLRVTGISALIFFITAITTGGILGPFLVPSIGAYLFVKSDPTRSTVSRRDAVLEGAVVGIVGAFIAVAVIVLFLIIVYGGSGQLSVRDDLVPLFTGPQSSFVYSTSAVCIAMGVVGGLLAARSINGRTREVQDRVRRAMAGSQPRYSPETGEPLFPEDQNRE